MDRTLKTLDVLPDGVWQVLLQHAYVLMTRLQYTGSRIRFGRLEAVLMLRCRHRLSQDIDIFVPET